MPETRTATLRTGWAMPLFVVFLVLKLTHVIAWSWWWVTVPLWGPAVILVGAFIGLAALTAALR